MKEGKLISGVIGKGC